MGGGHTPKTETAKLGIELVKKTLEIINYFDPKYFFIENPRGLLRKMPFMNDIPRTTVWYCQYGDDRAKPTDIWSNNIYSMFNQGGWQPRPECWNGNRGCHHEAAPRGSKTGTQGRSGAYDRSKVPHTLCLEVLNSCVKN